MGAADSQRGHSLSHFAQPKKLASLVHTELPFTLAYIRMSQRPFGPLGARA